MYTEWPSDFSISFFQTPKTHTLYVVYDPELRSETESEQWRMNNSGRVDGGVAMMKSVNVRSQPRLIADNLPVGLLSVMVLIRR